MKTPSKFKTVITKVLLFLLVWFASMILIGIVGSILYPEGDIPTFFSVVVLFVPIALATLAVTSRRNKSSDKKVVSMTRCDQPPVNDILPNETLKSVYCTNCGAKLMDNAVFCTNCGRKIYNAISAEPVSPFINTKSNNSAQTGYPTKTYRVTGIEHYLENIISLALENDDYTKTKRELLDDLMTEERIWKYNFYPVKVDLVPEPDNLYDPNAIKVIVDNAHVGYIKKGSCKHLLKVIADGRLGDIDCTIGGGPYKYISEDYNDNGNEKYEMERDEVGYSVVLHITEHEALSK